ncbi:hypothetical protein [Glycomyces paridis]|uniref:hypothetical protein n=1 Tax=Glycomyces paridis TaxID=2126555 RepID=UPI00130540A7|nr:hypothetical protein [Glycomyces paridis]
MSERGAVAEPDWRADWVPVDRRLLGVDRRTLVPAGLVVLLFLVANWALPQIDRAVAVDDPIRAGDVVQVGEHVVFTPAVGANLVAGARQGQSDASGSYPDTAAVTYRGTVFEVITDDYRGTPAELLAQIDKTSRGLRGPGSGFQVTGPQETVANAAGDQGVAAHYDSVDQTGLVAAFVFGGTGVEIQVLGPAQGSPDVTREVAAMLRSVQPVEGSGS